MYVTVNVDVDEVLEDLTDDEVQELYDERFSTQSAEELWMDLYEKRRALSLADFLTHLDRLIMDKTGRIL